jgi:hypothetical protein
MIYKINLYLFFILKFTALNFQTELIKGFGFNEIVNQLKLGI